jgi:signal transduction histidine kinase
VIGFTDLLLTSDLDAEQRRHAELIASSGRAMMRLLNDILDFSKVEAGQMQIANEAFDLRHAIDACVTLVRPVVEHNGVALHVEFSGALPKLVSGDGLRLRQIILNLLGNAAKFTRQGSITVRVAPVADANGATLAIAVEDTGIGIPRDRQAAIFEAFVQAEATTASRFGGTGLGLPISARLAALMGGQLVLDDDVGGGSRFVLR